MTAIGDGAPRIPAGWRPRARCATHSWDAALAEFGNRWPDLARAVTRGVIGSGLAANNDRRAEHTVRSLEQIHRAIREGVDVRGRYHWSLMGNFEWADSSVPHFDRYTVDRSTFARTPTMGGTVLGEIAGARTVSRAQLGHVWWPRADAPPSPRKVSAPMIVTVTCPACWQPTAIELTFDGATRSVEQYEDCQVCCHPMHIRATLPSTDPADPLGSGGADRVDVGVEPAG